MAEIKYYWEDFKPGEIFEFGNKLVTREEVVEFASAYDPQPFHLDEEAAKHSILGGLCASGWHICAMMMRMICDAYMNETANLGSPGLDEVRWMKPAYVGDILHIKRLCLESRPSKSNPTMGLTKFQWDIMNDKGAMVAQVTGWGMFVRRTAGESA